MSADLQRADDRLAVSGKMTLETAASLFASGTEALTGDVTLFDLAAVEDVDSSGLAVLFGWQRAAQAKGKTVKIANPPPSLISLAEVYGVSDLLPLS
jgi:phospholipid transport system transporter-binding protein